jgi:hypothetical protein
MNPITYPELVYSQAPLKKLLLIVKHDGLITNHQFGFSQRHSTIEQIHRILLRINKALENMRHCSAAFLDISQAIDKVWYT